MSSNHFNTEIFKFSKKIFLIIFNETLWILATCYLNTFHISSFYLLFIFFEIFLVLWYISMKMINLITFSVILLLFYYNFDDNVLLLCMVFFLYRIPDYICMVFIPLFCLYNNISCFVVYFYENDQFYNLFCDFLCIFNNFNVNVLRFYMVFFIYRIPDYICMVFIPLFCLYNNYFKN